MIPPKRIKVISDDNELEYQSQIKPNKVVHHVYKYTKSSWKKNELIGFTEAELEKMLKNGIIKVL